MSESKKIRVMHMNDSLNIGGAETMIFNLISDLNRQRITPFACSMSADNALKSTFLESGIPVYECPKKSGLDWKNVFRIAKILRRERIDILHTHNFSSWLWGGLATLFTPSCRLVHTQHSDIKLNRLPPAPLRSILARVSRQVAVVSDPVGKHLLDDGFCPAEKLRVIYNGIPLDTQKNDEDPDARHLAIVARLAPVKNHAFLIRSFAKVVRQHENIKLDILGDGPLMDDLQQLTRELGVEDQVNFWGQVHNARALMTSFDVFVLSSLSEGLSVSVLEALAAGLPVIATDVGGNSILVRDNENGLLVPSEDESAMVAAIEKLLTASDSAGLRDTMGQKSLQIVKSGFSNKTMVDKYQAIYAKAMGRGQL